MPHIIPDSPPGVTAALTVLAAATLAALVLVLLEHRRVSTVKKWVEGLDDEIGDLGGTAYRHGARLDAHAATLTLLAQDYEVPLPITGSRREWVVARVAQIRDESTARADELTALIRELEGPETQHALPEGWSVIEGDATLTGHAQRPALSVVTR